MAIVVKHRKVGIPAQKLRQVCTLIRKKKASEALKRLRFCERREIALVLTKLINSALSIAVNSDKYNIDNLVVSKIEVSEGTTTKRIMPRAQGRAFRINKRTGHISMELAEK